MVSLSNNERSWKVLAAAALLCAACGGDDTSGNEATPKPPGGNNEQAQPGDGGNTGSTGNTGNTGNTGSTAKPVYMYHTAVYKQEGEGGGVDVYVNLMDSLDFSKVKLEGAKVFPGYTGIATIGGKVLVGDGTMPFVYQFNVTDDLKLQETGRINFSAYPVDTSNYMNFYFHAFKSAESVYYFYGDEKTSRAVWNPSTAKIVTDAQDSKLPKAPAGMTLANYGNRTNNIGFNGPVVQPFGFRDEEYTDFGTKSWLAVYDEATHAEKNIHEINCPGLQQVTKDEKGDLYFSTTYNLPTKALTKTGPASCVVKVKADGSLDTSFAPNDMTAWTGGFYGVNFRYIANGKAIALILHHDRLKVDFTKPLDKATTDRISEDATLWEVEMIDLASGKSTPVTGFKPEHDIGNYLTGFSIDGRFFAVMQLNGETTDRTAIYEIKTDSTATYIGDVPGELWGVSRVR